MEQEKIQCEECKSLYYKSTSVMESLCPECSSILYGYDNCIHIFDSNNRCSKCFWDGSKSEYIKNLVKK